MRILMIFTLLVASQLSQAGWVLNNNRSEISFVATKDANVADNHYFTRFSGFIKDSGEAELSIQTASVETNINMRDKRLRSTLFRIDEYPEAKVSMTVRANVLEPRPPGSVQYLNVKAQLFMVGVSQLQSARLSVYQLTDGSLEVSTIQPILVDSEDFGMLPAINQLRELAGLKSLTVKVPVSFRLVFEPES